VLNAAGTYIQNQKYHLAQDISTAHILALVALVTTAEFATSFETSIIKLRDLAPLIAVQSAIVVASRVQTKSVLVSQSLNSTVELGTQSPKVVIHFLV
jgi:hypothetical protein